MSAKIDKMFSDAINHSERRMTLEELIEKYRPKLIETYHESGQIIKRYEAR